MQILDKAVTPDGMEIELHDLSGEPALGGTLKIHIKVDTGMSHKKVKNFGHLFIVVVTIQKTW